MNVSGFLRIAGRALNRSMHPFVPEELMEALDVGEMLRFGEE